MRVKLDSGIELKYNQDKTIDSTSIVIACKVGSTDEGPEYYGSAHLIEHMLFKGTLRHPTSESISKVFDDVGAYFNAYTDTHVTAYVVKCHSSDFNKCISVLVDMICCSTFVSTELDKEREVVIEEILEDDDDLENFCLDNLNKLIFNGSDYARRVSGSVKDIKKLTREKLFNFYKSYYVPSNMIISINTNLSYSKILHTLNGIKYLKKNGNSINKLYTPKLTIEIPNKRQVIKHLQSIQQTQLGLAFYFPFGFKDTKSSYIVWLLSRYLGGTMSSVIYIALREQAGIGYTVWSDVICKPDQSALTIYTSFEHRKKEKTMEIITDRLNILHRQGITAKDLKKLEISNNKSIAMRMENPMFLADYYANHLLYGIDDKPYKLPSINNDEVNNIIKKYMDPDNILISIVTK
jgi:predicted Zn-dependent peptidase